MLRRGIVKGDVIKEDVLENIDVFAALLEDAKLRRQPLWHCNGDILRVGCPEKFVPREKPFRRSDRWRGKVVKFR